MDQRLFSAAFAGDIDSLHKLLQENPFVLGDCMLGTQPENPLNIAAKAGQLHFAQEIIKIKPELAKELNQDGFRPLDVASAYGHVEIVRELLATFDPEICRLPGRDGRTAIHYAARSGKVEVIDELLNACSDSVKDVTSLCETALHLAVKYFKFDAFRRLVEWLEKIAPRELVNWKDKEGNTVLHCAVSRKQFETVEFMLDKNNHTRGIIEKNAVNTKGLTPLDILNILIESSTTDAHLRKLLQEAGCVGAPEVRIVSETDHSSPHENVRIPDKTQSSWLDYFRYQKERDSPAQAINMLLVVAALIATVTFQAGIDPPSHLFEVSAGQPTDSKISRDPNSTPPATQESVNHPSKLGVTLFLIGNTIALSTSLSIINYLQRGLPFQRELQVSCFFMAFAYGVSLGSTNPAGTLEYVSLFGAFFMPFFLMGLPDLVRSICSRQHKQDSPDQH